ncbi:MAG: hypothetical protein HY710_07575 [Candidatus Latescibacteria bacterium]|nr:hypothetical protein [Candidatus Latescibacterota bacterium]
MLRSLRYILTIAASERMMLYRTPKFWVLAAIGGFFTFVAVLGTTIASIVDGNPDGEFLLEGTDAWIALYFFSYVQTIIIIFVAGDFRKAEQQARLDQVMLSRPMTTANWVTGKYLGIVGALVVLNLAFIGISAIGRVFKVIFLGANFNLLPAIQYFGMVTVPSILFMAALVFFLISLLRLQALAILLPVGYVGVILFSVRHQYKGFLDYGCFMAPLFYSDLIGFGEINTLLWQRAFFVLLACALVCGTILLYPRLRQSTGSQRMTQATGVISLAAAIIIAASVWSRHTARTAVHEADLTYQSQWRDTPRVQIKHYDFDITMQKSAEPLRVTVRLAVYNPHPQPVDTLLFALNGALAVRECRWSGAGRVTVHQAHHLVAVILADRPMAPGAVDTLTLSYAGRVDADAFMMERLPDDKGVIPKSGNGPWIKGNIAAWIDGRVVVLPAQSGWYPTPGAAAGHPYEAPRPANFATATFRIHAPDDVQVVTQGMRRTEWIADGQRHAVFDVDTPTPAFSLNAGPYIRLARRFPQTEVEVFFYKGHLLNHEVFSDVADTCFQTVERLFELYETATGTRYPYPRLSLVEVPLQMQVYTTRHGVDNVLLQPGVIMIDELRFAEKRFKKTVERFTENARRNGRDDTPWRIKREVFVRTVLGVFMPDRLQRDSSLYSPVRNYYHFRVDLAHPVLSRGLELQFQEAVERRIQDTFFPDRRDVALSTYDRLRRNDGDAEWAFDRRYNTKLDSVLTVLQRIPLADVRPHGDGTQYRAMVDVKASPVFDMLQDRVGERAYHTGLASLITERPYQRIGLDDFLHTLQTYNTVDVASFAARWLHGTAFPGYRIVRAEAEKWDTGRMQIAYQVKVRVQNGEEGDGFVRVVFKTRRDRISRSLALSSFQEKELHVITTDLPEHVQVIPFFARNRGLIMKPVTVGQRLHRGVPVDTVFTVASIRDSLDFVVDDQDAGFFFPQTAETRYLRPPAHIMSWRQVTAPEAYGRYIFGFRYRWASDGEYPARWETRVPRTGLYEISLHMPSRQPMQRRYHLMIEAADGVHEATIHPQGTKSEWWPIGRYAFDRDRPAVVELSDKGKGYILADALRWTYVKGE